MPGAEDRAWPGSAGTTRSPPRPRRSISAARHPRVSRVDRGWATVLDGRGTARVQLAGHSVVTGDWVLVRHDKIAGTLARRSAFVRGDSGEGRTRRPQVVAANVDLVFVVQALNNGPNLRRLERELVLAFESGAAPVVVLSKADLVDAADRRARYRDRAGRGGGRRRRGDERGHRRRARGVARPARVRTAPLR